MDFNIDGWLNLAIRWFHVMAGIMWIGTSFFFIWLDNVLQAEPEGGKGHVGKAWLFHGGGFYQVEKSLVAPASILKSLHWFKWEAYVTWLSGFALLVVVYWWRADLYMIDPAVAPLSVAQSIGVGLGMLVVGWLVGMAAGTWMFVLANLSSVYAIKIGGFSLPPMYAAFTSVILNLVLAVILTPLFELIGAKRGEDETSPEDYYLEEVPLTPEQGKEALG